MRARRGVLLGWCLALCAAFGCAGVARRAADSSAQAGQGAASFAYDPAHDARELAELLPADADRCFVTVPPRLAPQDLAVGPLLSQVEGLPWSLALPVSAYARAELSPPNGDRRLVREYVRFAQSGRARIRKELDRALEPRIRWDAPNLTCESESTCVSVAAEFVDDRTVLLSTGE